MGGPFCVLNKYLTSIREMVHTLSVSLAVQIETTRKPSLLGRNAPCMAVLVGPIPTLGSKELTRGGEVASRKPHKLEIVGSNPTCATNIKPQRVGSCGDRPAVGQTEEAGNAHVKSVTAPINPGFAGTRPDQFSRLAFIPDSQAA